MAKNSILHAKTYREFLQLRYEILKEENPQFNYSMLAKLGAFSSRGFPKEVMQGARRVTLKNLSGFARAFKLKGDWKTFFTLLVMLEEKDVNQRNLTVDQIRVGLRKIKNRIEAKENPAPRPPAGALYQIPHCADIFAALGSPERGASFAEIEKRTQLSFRVLQSSLSKMLEAQACTFDAETLRYRALSPHLFYESAGKERFFKEAFLEALEKTKSASSEFDRADRLFFCASFSVDQRKLSDFKIELQALALKFIDHAESAEGDTIARCMISLF